MFLFYSIIPININASTKHILILKETARGMYYDGKYEESYPQFNYRVEIIKDIKTSKKAFKWTDVTRIKTGNIISIETEFIQLVDKRIPLFAPAGREKEPISIFIGQTGAAIVEIFMIGDSYFEYVKVGVGKVDVASGKIKKSVTPDEDLNTIIK